MKNRYKMIFLFLSLTLVSFSLHGKAYHKPSEVSDLDRIIPPEVKNDAFYNAIYRLAKTEPLTTILEIGSSSGQGSTDAFVSAIRDNPYHPTLFCVEISSVRFHELATYYKDNPFVRCYNVSSIPLEKFPGPEEVCHFYQTIPSKLNQFSLPVVLSWLKLDTDYVQREGVCQHGIELIRKENNIEHFDMVLIDGSEFTGMAEFEQIYGARFILLDDTCTFKNYQNREKLLNDPAYQLIEEDPNLRHGYAIFKRKA